MLNGVHKEVNLIIIIATVQLVSRGADYLTGNPNPGVGAFEIGNYTPALVWGLTCLSVAAIITIGLLLKSHRTVRNGAAIAMCVYLAFAVVVCDAVFKDGLDDWRFFTGYIIGAATWLVLAGSLTMSIAVIENREGDYEHKRFSRNARNH